MMPTLYDAYRTTSRAGSATHLFDYASDDLAGCCDGALRPASARDYSAGPGSGYLILICERRATRTCCYRKRNAPLAERVALDVPGAPVVG